MDQRSDSTTFTIAVSCVSFSYEKEPWAQKSFLKNSAVRAWFREASGRQPGSWKRRRVRQLMIRVRSPSGPVYLGNRAGQRNHERKETTKKLESIHTPCNAPYILATASEGVPSRRRICFVKHIAR